MPTETLPDSPPEASAGTAVSSRGGDDLSARRLPVILPSLPVGRALLAAASLPIAALIALALHHFLRNQQDTFPTRLYPRLLWILFTFGSLTLIAARWKFPRVWIRANLPLFAAATIMLSIWDCITLKFDLLPLPYFPGPDMVFQSMTDNWHMLAICAYRSLLLLSCGYGLGCILGIICGVLIGWSPYARYWGMPVLKIVGPIPATALVPLVLLLFPTAFISGMVLIIFAVWFPVTMLTASGIANVRLSYFDVARTLGAKRTYLIFRVAIPAAMPSIFIGLFMGLGSSFLTLIVAETVGAKAGLGWYIDWAKIWADYAKVYAALIIMAAFFSTIMTLLFKVRDRALVWQKGVIKW
jgi:NitT/TauT family transport system permease protein